MAIKVVLAIFAIVAAVGLFAAATVVNTAYAPPPICPEGKKSLSTPAGFKCIPVKAKAPPAVDGANP